MKFTEEEKREYREMKRARIKQLRAILAGMSPDQRQAMADQFGIVTVEGHQLTPYNQCFLVAQSPISFSVVGGYRQWKKAGRIVRQGEHGFYILVPHGEKDESGKIEEAENFWTVTVFDVSQTDSIIESLKAENINTYILE